MEDLLQFINKHCNFLFLEYKFNVIETYLTESFGDNALVILESNILMLKIIKERGEIAFYFQGKTFIKKKYWYDLDLIRNIIQKNKSYQFDKNRLTDLKKIYDLKIQTSIAMENISFLKKNMDQILYIFSDTEIGETMKLLKKFSNQRAKILFG